MTLPIRNEIVHLSLDYTPLSGDPPAIMVRKALKEVLMGLAFRLERFDGGTNSDGSLKDFFPTEFPMHMKLESEQVLWDFHIKATLQNGYAIKESQIAEAEA